jgi:MFS family permease
MPKAFTQSSLHFGHEPADADLAVLLGDLEQSAIMTLHDSPELLRGSPELFPLKFGLAVVLSLASAFTAMPWLAPLIGASFDDRFVWAAIALLWCGIVPAMLAIFIAADRSLRNMGDSFLLNKTQKTLELCQLGRIVHASEIRSPVELSRFYFAFGEWNWTRQVSALVRDESGGFELLPIARENVVRPFGISLADQLAGIFGVDVRRISLTRAQSKRLPDWVIGKWEKPPRS